MLKPRRRESKRLETMQRNAVISPFTPSIRLGVRGLNDPEPEIEGSALVLAKIPGILHTASSKSCS